MNEKRKTLFLLDLFGVLVIFFISAALWFFGKAAAGGALGILFGAQNQSVWEHLKVIAAGFVFFSVVELLWFPTAFRRLFCAKVLSLYALCALGAIVFCFLQRASLIKQAVAALFLILIAQLLSAVLFKQDRIKEAFLLCAMLMMLFFLMFFSFTIFPPQWFLFRDPFTGICGILNSDIDAGALYLSGILV